MLKNTGLFNRIYIPPGPNDASCSIGAALLVSCRLEGNSWRPQPPLDTVLLGTSYDSEAIICSLKNAGMEATRLSHHELIDLVATDLASDAIVAWYQGRSEFGPRALGSRSLLSSAASRDNHRRMNSAKGREQWRPFAPSILADDYQQYFEDMPDSMSRFMLKSVPVRSSRHHHVPAIIHVDGTARPHTVIASDGIFFELLTAYREQTNLSLIMNTSLNRMGEPIVETPSDAITLFKQTPQVDVMVIGEYYVSRR